MFESFLGKFKLVFKSPLTVFVYSILSKWFITIFITALVVTYWVFKGLSDAGILQKAEEVVFDALVQTKSVAQYCIPKIAHLGNFWDCLQNPPTYTPSDEELQLEEGVKRAMRPLNPNKLKDPYSNED